VATLATLKGGSGKSTLVRALAAHWFRAGEPVAVIDADPQATVANWHLTEGSPLQGMTVVADTSDRIGQTIDRLRGDHRPILIDTPGFRGRATINALAASDLAVIPCRASPDDVRVTLDTYRLVLELNETRERQGRPILPTILLTMITQGSVIGRHIRGELEDAGYPVLRSELTNRVAYAEAALSGSMPSMERPSGPAAREIQHLATELATLQDGNLAT
jgi:chromosome partitioning protein